MDAMGFETDLREFFQALQCRKDKKKLNELCRSERFRNLRPEAVQAIAVHIDRTRLMPKVKKEGVTMCQAFDELMEDMRQEGIREGEAKGLKAGIKEGLQEGERKGKISIIRRMLAEGLDETLICRVARCSEEELAAAGR
ncbi:MAG: hypothetical protein NC312_08880 [Bacteroides fragilis]|nr:hypothetical protein [Bacteroides fragilis]